jgi:hypothetical protein
VSYLTFIFKYQIYTQPNPDQDGRLDARRHRDRPAEEGGQTPLLTRFVAIYSFTTEGVIEIGLRARRSIIHAAAILDGHSHLPDPFCHKPR